MRAFGLFFLTFFLATNLAYSQRGPVDIKWGDDYKEPRNSVLTDFIGKDENGFYALRQGTGTGILAKDGSVFVERYNSRMKLVKSYEIELKYKKKDLVFEDIQLVGDQLILFTSFKNRKKKTHYLFAQSISKKSLKPRKDMVVVSQVPTRRQGGLGTFDIDFSRDSSKFVVLSQLPYQTNTPEKYKIKVMNSSLEEEWTEDITLPYKDEAFSIEKFGVDNEGNVFILGLIYKDGRRRMKRSGKPNYQYTLLTYSKGGNFAPEYKIDLQDQFITDLTFQIQKNGDPLCAGFFSDRNSYSIRGIYFFKISKETGDVYNVSMEDFEFDFLTELMSNRKKKRAERAEQNNDEKRQAELFQYDLDKVVPRSDGGALLVAEQYYITTQNERFRDVYGYWQTRISYEYHYNDIIVVNISPEGVIEWSTHVPKRQQTSNDGGYFSSYAIAVTSKAIYMVFNDNGKNFDKNRNRDRLFAYNGSRSIVTLAEVKADGSLTKYPLFSNREEGIITRPKVCRQSGRDEIIIYGERNRKYKFATVKFD